MYSQQKPVFTSPKEKRKEVKKRKLTLDKYNTVRNCTTIRQELRLPGAIKQRKEEHAYMSQCLYNMCRARKRRLDTGNNTERKRHLWRHLEKNRELEKRNPRAFWGVFINCVKICYEYYDTLLKCSVDMFSIFVNSIYFNYTLRNFVCICD